MTAIHRPIRSFVLRQGRVSNAQQRAHDTLLPRYGIPFAPHIVDLDQAFGRSAPKILEIGFGMGETTAAIAAAHPENDYLGIEVHTPGVGSLLKQIAALELANVCVIQHDAVEVLTQMIAPSTFDGVHIFFPDPWPKKRHHKRRLIQPPFLALLVGRMKHRRLPARRHRLAGVCRAGAQRCGSPSRSYSILRMITRRARTKPSGKPNSKAAA